MFDGGAYASTSSAVLINAITHAQGPYRCANAVVDGYAVRTNNLPCGAMRGFGVVQACFAHEGQMDKLAAACGLDPVEIRLRNAMATGDRLITGQVVESVAPVARCIRETAALPMPDEPDRRPTTAHPMRLPGGAGLTADRRPRRAAASAGAWRSRTSCTPRASTTTRRPVAAWPHGRGHAQVRHRRGRPGLRHHRRADRPHRSSVSTRWCSSRIDTAHRVGRLDVGVAPDVDERRRRRRGVPGGARAICSTASGPRNGLDPLRLVIDGDDVVDSMGTLRVPVAEALGGVDVRARRSSSATDPPRTSTRTVRATATPRSRSSPTAPSSTSIPSSAS